MYVCVCVCVCYCSLIFFSHNFPQPRSHPVSELSTNFFLSSINLVFKSSFSAFFPIQSKFRLCFR